MTLTSSAIALATIGALEYTALELFARRARYCVIIPVLNEGARLRQQLDRMKPRAEQADIIIADGGSDDGSTQPDYLRAQSVRSLLVTKEQGLGTAIRMGLHYALAQGYEGVVTVDGNNKDGVERLPDFLRLLEDGADFVQGSRFMPGGSHANTPVQRSLGIRLVVAPVLYAGGGGWYSDPTNGFKAMSRRFLEDSRVQPIRAVFRRFNLQLYLNYRAAKLGFRWTETPVTRVYPADGSIPTKITSLRTKLLFVWELLQTATGHWNPR